MLIEIAFGGVVAAAGGAVGFLIAKKIQQANYDIFIAQAKAKAKAIENEANILLQNAKLKSKEIESEAERKYEEKLLASLNIHSQMQGLFFSQR